MATPAGGNIEHYRERLHAMERELRARLGRDVETARGTRDDQASASDLAHTDERKDEYFALAQADAQMLTQVRGALRRIENGTFGRCVVDGGEIEPERLEAAPWARYCLEHQRNLEERRLRTPTL
jgi:DnaK suppressor protein